MEPRTVGTELGWQTWGKLSDLNKYSFKQGQGQAKLFKKRRKHRGGQLSGLVDSLKEAAWGMSLHSSWGGSMDSLGERKNKQKAPCDLLLIESAK